MADARAAGVGAGIGAGVGLALLLLQYTFAMPTSDIRARFHFLFATAPWSVGLSLLAVLLIAGVLGVLVTGWWTPWAVAGAAAGAILAFLLLLPGLFGYLVWANTGEVSRAGQWIRAAVALVLLAGVVGWACHVRHREAAA